MRYKKISILYLTLLIFFMSLVTFSYAFYKKSETKDIMIETGKLDINVLLYLDDVIIDESSMYYDPLTLTYTFDITNQEAMNHIERLKVVLYIETDIHIKVRFKLLESYVVTRTYHMHEGQIIEPYTRVISISKHSDTYYPFSLFKKGLSETLIEGEDGYLYFKDTIEKGNHQYLLIDGGLSYFGMNHQTFEESGYVSFNLIVEAVQSNRYEAFWGIDASFYAS